MGRHRIYFAFPAQFRDTVNWISPLTVVVRLPQRPPRRRASSELAELVARAQQERRGEHVARMVPPADEKAAFVVMFEIAAAGRARRPHAGVPRSAPGRRARSPDVRRSAGDVVMDWAGWLHVGGFGGNGVRIAWFVLGLAAASCHRVHDVVDARRASTSLNRQRSRQGANEIHDRRLRALRAGNRFPLEL